MNGGRLRRLAACGALAVALAFGVPAAGQTYSDGYKFLEAVDVSRSDFARAELPGAVLAHANLTAATFEDANLQDADLSSADATGAEFPGANLSGAVLDHTILAGADLGAALGLTATALATACGDDATRLPPGLSVEPCAEAAWAAVAIRRSIALSSPLMTTPIIAVSHRPVGLPRGLAPSTSAAIAASPQGGSPPTPGGRR